MRYLSLIALSMMVVVPAVAPKSAFSHEAEPAASSAEARGAAPGDAQTGASDETSSPTQSRYTEPGVVMGTASYMAPEQVRGQAVDARTDIFALGAVLFEMLTGQGAFRRDTGAE